MIGASTRSKIKKPIAPGRFGAKPVAESSPPPQFDKSVSQIIPEIQQSTTDLKKELAYVDSSLSKKIDSLEAKLDEILSCLQQRSLTVSLNDTLDQISKSLTAANQSALNSISNQLKDLQMQIESLNKANSSEETDTAAECI